MSWPETFAARYREKGYWRGETFSDALRGWVDRYGDRTAIVAGDARVS